MRRWGWTISLVIVGGCIERQAAEDGDLTDAAIPDSTVIDAGPRPVDSTADAIPPLALNFEPECPDGWRPLSPEGGCEPIVDECPDDQMPLIGGRRSPGQPRSTRLSGCRVHEHGARSAGATYRCAARRPRLPLNNHDRASARFARRIDGVAAGNRILTL